MKIPKIIQCHIHYLSENQINISETNKIYDALNNLLNGEFQTSDFNIRLLSNQLNDIDFQKIMSTINEKQQARAINGVYYTPPDVVNFIIFNCFNKIIAAKDDIIINEINTNLEYVDIESLIFSKQIFDPTCGSGEFLISALQHKVDLYSKKYKITDSIILKILKTIHGNDINSESIEITKLRLFFATLKYISNSNSYHEMVLVLNQNLTVGDFVNIDKTKFLKYDIILGNPPYVEHSKTVCKAMINYGNIYANVLQNSLDVLSENGVLGFVIPISYISTPRMNKIRTYVELKTKKQFILNFADRPDCLFTSVHQKLSILICLEGDSEHKVYSSSYNYWYKNERENLFNIQKICHNPYIKKSFYPKIGNPIELSVFNKVYTETENNLIDLSLNNVEHNVFLNMRACFWIKVFSFNPGSKEYKGFAYDSSKRDLILCLLNSSLYFLFWVIVSDCWHITSKELKYFRVPTIKLNENIFTELVIELENELNKTKKYIGSKQTEYEYKHRLCKPIIDKIDDNLAKIYKLTKKETSYIKSFASKYRESIGNK